MKQNIMFSAYVCCEVVLNSEVFGLYKKNKHLTKNVQYSIKNIVGIT